MWLNIPSAKTAPENAGKAVEILDREESRQPFQVAPGFRYLFLVNRPRTRARCCRSRSGTREDGQAFYNSDQYRRVLGGVAALIIAPPERRFYTVRFENHAAGAAAARSACRDSGRLRPSGVSGRECGLSRKGADSPLLNFTEINSVMPSPIPGPSLS